MGFGLAGALMGLGSSLKQFADMKLQEIQEERRRQKDLEANLKLKSASNGVRKEKTVALSKEDQAMINEAFSEEEWDQLGPEGKIAALQYAERVKAEAESSGQKLTPTSLAAMVRSSAQRGDLQVEDKGNRFNPFDNKTVVKPGEGPFTGKFGAPQSNPLDQIKQEAIDAIRRGADPAAVRQRLLERGIDPGFLG